MSSERYTPTTNKEVIRCTNCGANNKVDFFKVGKSSQAICGRCQQPLLASTHPLTVTDTNFLSIVEKSTLPVLLDLWAPWCGPCRAIAPVIEQLAKELSGKVRVAKLNVDENPVIASKFNVNSIPTLLVLKNGREVERIVGVQPKTEILRRLSNVC